MDAFLLRKFPGRTLEELDAMDWPRFMRAMEADGVMRVEEARDAQIRDKVKPTPDTWKRIVEHDRLYKSSKG